MKKLTLACLAILALMAISCNKNVPPTLALTYELGDNLSEVEVGTTVNFHFDCQGKKLETLKITITNGNETLYSENRSLGSSDATIETLAFTLTQVGHTTLNAILQDAKDNTTTASCSFECIAKPVFFFEGTYEGYSLIDGTANALGFAYPIPADTIPISAVMTATDQESQVSISLTYDGVTYSTFGTINGTHIDFDPFDVDVEIEGSAVTGTIDLEGDKTSNVLIVTGTIEGQGTVTIEDIPFPVPVTMSGIVNGEMTCLE